MAPQVIRLFAIEVVRDHPDNIKMNRSYQSPQIEVSGSFCDASNLSMAGSRVLMGNMRCAHTVG